MKKGLECSCYNKQIFDTQNRFPSFSRDFDQVIRFCEEVAAFEEVSGYEADRPDEERLVFSGGSLSGLERLVPTGRHTKSRIKNIILEMEEHGLTFSLEEIIKHAVKKHIPRPEASAVLDELIKENYLRYIPGTDKLYMRSVWRDFSPAFEELPEF